MFFKFCDFVNGTLWRKQAWPTPNNSAELREHADVTFNNVQHIVVIGIYLVKIRKTVCFEHDVQEFVVLNFGHLLVYF